MQIAKVQNGQVVQVGHYRELFPNTSFPTSGPSEDFLTQNECVKVTMWVEYDAETQVLESTAPYLLDGKVCLVKAVALPQEAIDERNAQQAAIAFERAKAERAATVEKIVVTVSSGKQFDGDEVSQNRMARTIVALERSGVATWPWRLADNTQAQVTLEELTEALQLAGSAQTDVWMI